MKAINRNMPFFGDL